MPGFYKLVSHFDHGGTQYPPVIAVTFLEYFRDRVGFHAVGVLPHNRMMHFGIERLLFRRDFLQTQPYQIFMELTDDHIDALFIPLADGRGRGPFEIKHRRKHTF